MPIIKSLMWGKESCEQDEWKDSNFDFIVASDVVYIPETFSLLVETFQHFHRSNPELIIFLAYKKRYAREQKFFTLLRNAGFKKRDLMLYDNPAFFSQMSRNKLGYDSSFHFFKIWKEE